jgi:arsenite/tail-anchored protein-transporting ATPase
VLSNTALQGLPMLADLLRSRLVLVTGKGGVGKTSFSAALGMASASMGRRTLVVEVDNFHPSLTSVFGTAPGYEPKMVGENLGICNITWKRALQDWLVRTVHVSRIVKLIQRNRIAMLFLDATPGAREIVILSKIVDLISKWDLVIVDLPASGHALGILRVPNTAMKLMRTGPIHDRAGKILDAFTDRETSTVFVGLPEEMVVNETIEFRQKLREELPRVKEAMAVLNRSSLPTLSDDERLLMSRLEESPKLSEFSSEVLLSGRWEEELEQATKEAIQRLEEVFEEELLLFPRLGHLGGYGGGPEMVVAQMKSAILRSIQLEEGK